MTWFRIMTKSGDVLSVHQAARELGLSPRAVRHRIKAGTIDAGKLGDGRTSAYVINRTEIERLLQQEASA